jgi:hypothetical protein
MGWGKIGGIPGLTVIFFYAKSDGEKRTDNFRALLKNRKSVSREKSLRLDHSRLRSLS